MRRRAALKSCVIVQDSRTWLRLERLDLALQLPSRVAVALALARNRLLAALAEELFHHARGFPGVVGFALDALARFDAVDEARLRHLAKTLLVQTHRDGRLGGEFGGDFERLFEHLVFVNEVMNETDAMTLLGFHQTARQRQFDGARHTEHRVHDPRAGRAGDARVDFRLAHAHAGMPDADITKQRYLESRTRGRTV